MLSHVLVCRAAVAFTVVVAVLGAQLALGSSVSAAPTAELRGTVTDAGGVPLESICVWSPSGFGASTDAAGEWSMVGLEPGSYVLAFQDCSAEPQYLSEWFDGADSEAAAVPVVVAEGEVVSVPPVALRTGVVFTGTVTDAGGAPLENISVSVMSATGSGGGWATTAADGTYRSSPVADGSYRVQFTDSSPTPVYARELFNDTFRWNEAELISVSAAANPLRAGVDASLVAGATLSGTTTSVGGAPLAGVCVAAIDAVTFDWFASTTSDASGNWELAGVAPTNTKVQFIDCSATPSHVDQFFDAAGSFEAAQVLALTPGAAVHVVDAEMVPGAVVTGTVTDAGGAPLENISVSVSSESGAGGGWARTAADGTYRTSAMIDGSYRVQFRDDNQVFATEYFDDAPTWESATLVELSGADRTGVDASLELGSSLSGTVRGPGAVPAPGVCVNVMRGDVSSPQWVGGVRTDASGNYSLGGLYSGQMWVQFTDCDATGPFLTQFYEAAASLDAATPVQLAVGANVAGVDAALEPASLISGTVTGPGGVPLEGMCVQASTATASGEMVGTDSSGNYRLLLAAAGDYRVQFSACRSGGYASVWYGGNADPASAQWVSVAPGAPRAGVDVELVPTALKSSVSGRVSNARGDAMAACAVLFMPTQAALFAQTDAAGNFRFDDVPAGSWFLAYAGCGPYGPEPTVPDAGASGASFSAVWFGGAAIDWAGGSPDPFGQDAQMVVVTPGASIVADRCFGCDAIEVLSVSAQRRSSAEVAFEMSGVDPGASAPSFTVSCSAPGAATVTGSGASSPVTVSGFADDVTYSCEVTASVAGALVASAETFDFTGPVPPDPGPGPTPGPTPAPEVAPGDGDAPPADGDGVAPLLAVTGSNVLALLVLAVFSLAFGSALLVAARRAGRVPPLRAPGSEDPLE